MFNVKIVAIFLELMFDSEGAVPPPADNRWQHNFWEQGSGKLRHINIYENHLKLLNVTKL